MTHATLLWSIWQTLLSAFACAILAIALTGLAVGQREHPWIAGLAATFGIGGLSLAGAMLQAANRTANLLTEAHAIPFAGERLLHTDDLANRVESRCIRAGV